MTQVHTVQHPCETITHCACSTYIAIGNNIIAA